MSQFERLDVKALLGSSVVAAGAKAASVANREPSVSGLSQISGGSASDSRDSGAKELAALAALAGGHEQIFESEGYFVTAPDPGFRIRLKLPMIINRCRLYAYPLAEKLGEDPPPYRLPHSLDDRKRASDRLAAWLSQQDVAVIARQRDDVYHALTQALGDEAVPAIARPYALAALAGQLAADAGLERWSRRTPLTAAYDYLEVILHARWSREGNS